MLTEEDHEYRKKERERVYSQYPHNELVGTVCYLLKQLDILRDSALVLGFDVIDSKTGECPDVEKIALEEDWAKHLIYCDIDGFFIGEDGTLVLADDCGKIAYCPAQRFEIKTIEDEEYKMRN